MLTVKINFSDSGLFGNDVAEDEEEDIFNAYALQRSEVKSFSDATERIRIVRAYKGEGKSALIRITKNKVAENKAFLVVQGTGATLSPDCSSSDTDLWVRGWKERILRQIASEIGSRMCIAWTDDAMSLVEEAEKNSFKSRNIISSIWDRLKPRQVVATKIGAPNPEQLLKRWMESKTPVWIFIDDVDQNFQNTSRYRAKVAAFFIACRQIVNMVPQIVIRAGVRPNIWTTVKRELEALSHVEQYIIDLRWSEGDIKKLLANRVRGHFLRGDKKSQSATTIFGQMRMTGTRLLLILPLNLQWVGGHRQTQGHLILFCLLFHVGASLVDRAM